MTDIVERLRAGEAKVMAPQFSNRELRDALASRLSSLAAAMIRSRDQGHDGRITVTDEAIDDLRTAAYVVGMTDTGTMPVSCGQQCKYPECKCCFLWCEGKHPPCPITGRRVQAMRDGGKCKDGSG